MTVSTSYSSYSSYSSCSSHDFGHVVATNGGMLALTVWDDANSNQEIDGGETVNRSYFSVTGHSMSVTNRLDYGNFDRDGDNLPDWWEVANGLSTNGVKADEYADPDNDGLINLHEFWAGTNPLVPDGSNTLLSVCARSVDDRIANIVNPGEEVGRFVDFIAKGRNGTFVANTNFWARDLDFGCVSVWHGQPIDGSGEMPATAITRRHVIMAEHWHDDDYVFMDSCGTQYVRHVIDVYPIGGTDLRLGRLDYDLPDTITIPMVLPTDYGRLISTGKFLPTICMTHEKTASVAELVSLNCSQENTNGRIFHLLGQTDSTNHVGVARNQVRAVTTDGFSGCPVFLVADRQLVFLFSKHMGLRDVRTWSPYWGPMISHHLNVIQTVIDIWEGDDAESYRLNILSPDDFEQLGGLGGSR